MSRSPSRWRTIWALFVRGFKTLLPLPESKQEAWSYRATTAPAKRQRAATKSGKAAKPKTTKTSKTASTRKKATATRQQSGGGRKSGQRKKSSTTRGNRGR